MRPITDDEWPAYWGVLAQAFHDDFRQDESDFEREVFEPERSLAVFDGDQPVATTGAYSRDLTIPGVVTRAAHVSMVAVRATHRRRGLLTRMMRQQLRDVQAAGVEPIAALWASEETIYGRYGYGPASYGMAISADTREMTLLPRAVPSGRLRLVDPNEAAGDLAAVYDRARPERPGFSSRHGVWWRYRLTDVERHRKGATSRRCVVHEDASGVTGYALWRSKPAWDRTGPNHEIAVEEIVCPDPDARAELWRFLFNIDLSRKVSAANLAVDEPLFRTVNAPRRLSRQHGDGLFVRIVDLPNALAARRYAAPVDLVLDVTDELLPENAGRWRLIGDGEKATCERVDGPADLTLDVRELGALYLGGTSAGSLASAGLLTERRSGALAAASAGFGWHVAPHAPEVF
ncbi:MAG: GNAT family N-acetyltransferase [Micromonosporaceae bacterium]|nr:GNAT family N-acetyltransferase [Micromonosporaceae bacterium]